MKSLRQVTKDQYMEMMFQRQHVIPCIIVRHGEAIYITKEDKELAVCQKIMNCLNEQIFLTDGKEVKVNSTSSSEEKKEDQTKETNKPQQSTSILKETTIAVEPSKKEEETKPVVEEQKKPKVNLTEEIFIDLYIKQNKTLKEISAELGINYNTLNAFMTKHKLSKKQYYEKMSEKSEKESVSSP